MGSLWGFDGVVDGNDDDDEDRVVLVVMVVMSALKVLSLEVEVCLLLMIEMKVSIHICGDNTGNDGRGGDESVNFAGGGSSTKGRKLWMWRYGCGYDLHYICGRGECVDMTILASSILVDIGALVVVVFCVVIAVMGTRVSPLVDECEGIDMSVLAERSYLVSGGGDSG